MIITHLINGLIINPFNVKCCFNNDVKLTSCFNTYNFLFIVFNVYILIKWFLSTIHTFYFTHFTLLTSQIFQEVKIKVKFLWEKIFMYKYAPSYI